METDPDKIADNILTILNEVLDENTPVTTKQVNKHLPDYVSMETKLLIIERNEALHHAKTTGENDDLRRYKNIKNQVNKNLYEDNCRHQRHLYSKDQDNTTAQYRTARQQLGWHNSSPPSRIVSNGVLLTKPLDIANAMNHEYKTKNNTTSENIPDNGINPLDNYRRVVKTPKEELRLKTLTMHKLRRILDTMRPTPSS